MPMIANALHDVPELIDGSQRHRNQKTDVYSFGSTMLEVIQFLILTSVISLICGPYHSLASYNLGLE